MEDRIPEQAEEIGKRKGQIIGVAELKKREFPGRIGSPETP